MRRCHRPRTAPLVAQFALLPAPLAYISLPGALALCDPLRQQPTLLPFSPMKPFFRTFAFLVAVILVPFTSDALALILSLHGNYLVTVEVNVVATTQFKNSG